MTPEFHPAAQEELAAAVKIGETRAAGLELLFETQRVVALLCDLPEVGEPLDERYRRFPLRRFPFGVVYRVDGSRLQIIASRPPASTSRILGRPQVTSNYALERSVTGFSERAAGARNHSAPAARRPGYARPAQRGR